MSVAGGFVAFVVFLIGLTPPAFHNYLLYSGAIIDLRAFEIVVCVGFLLLITLGVYRFRFSKIISIYMCFIVFQALNYSINKTFAEFLEAIYSGFIPLIILACGYFKYTYRDVEVLFKLVTVVVWLNVFFAIFFSSFYSGASDQRVIFSNVGGGIPTAWMLYFWMVADEYISRRSYRGRSMLLLLVTICIFALDSRSVLASLLVYIFIMIFRNRSYILGFGLLTSVFVSILFFDSFLGRISNVDFADNSSLLRFNAVSASLHIIEDNYVLGSGVGKFFPRIDKNISEDLVTESGNAGRVIEDYILPTEPHNSYLLFGVEYGLIGILFVLCMNIRTAHISGKFDFNVLLSMLIMFATSSVLKFDLKLLFLVIILMAFCRKQKEKGLQ